MKTIHICLWILFGCFIIYTVQSCSKSSNQEKKALPVNILLYSKTKAFRHECIEVGREALQRYFLPYGISMTMTEDSSVFTAEGLKAFDVVMFFQTTGNVLDSAQEIAFQNFIKSGKGYVGVHAASDTEYNWPWYGQLVGTYFDNHPDVQEHVIEKVDTSHMSCKHLPARWKRVDECYNFKFLPNNVNVLLTADESTYQGGQHGNIHPMSWYHTYDGGRSFYTALGHTVESYLDTLFLEHVRQGVVWASNK